VELSGAIAGPKWTAWLTLGSDATLKFVNVDFHSNGDGTVGPGVVGESFEYRRYQSGVATPFFTNLRFPGQYYDQESDLFENWNRYYEPLTGRYLAPEPMFRDPKWVADEGREGFSAATYAYALNNPLAFIDPDGNKGKKSGAKKKTEPANSEPCPEASKDPKCPSTVSFQSTDCMYIRSIALPTMEATAPKSYPCYVRLANRLCPE
jgi:RHS repeat-associated protein